VDSMSSHSAGDRTKRATTLLQSMRAHARRTADEGSQAGAQLVERIKVKAQALTGSSLHPSYPCGERVAGGACGSHVSRGSRTSDRCPSFASRGANANGGDAANSAAASRSAASGIAELDAHKVEQLVMLGFSVAAVRHSLRRNRGRVEEAAVWLLDEGNGNEILAAEVADRVAVPLRIGRKAKIAGLRGAAHLNGTPVLLKLWDAESQRWIVQMQGGSHKSIRPRNLEGLRDQVAVEETKSETTLARDDVGGKTVARESWEEAVEAEAVEVGAASFEGVEGLGPKEAEEAETREFRRLMGELIWVGDTAACASAEANECLGALSAKELLDAIAHLSHEATPSATPPDLASLAARLGVAAYTEELECHLREAAERANALEAQQLRCSVATEAREAELFESQARWRMEAEAKNEEIQRLENEQAAQMLAREEAKAASAIQELASQQEALRRAAEDRELRVLEEEAKHMRIADSLHGEQQRLEIQRRSILLLQRSLTDTITDSGLMPKSSVCVEMMFDDAGVLEELAPQHGTVGHPARRSVDGAGDTRNGVVDADRGASDSGNEPVSEEAEAIWDLDWSQLAASPTLVRGTAQEQPPLSDDHAAANATAVNPPVFALEPVLLAPSAITETNEETEKQASHPHARSVEMPAIDGREAAAPESREGVASTPGMAADAAAACKVDAPQLVSALVERDGVRLRGIAGRGAGGQGGGIGGEGGGGAGGGRGGGRGGGELEGEGQGETEGNGEGEGEGKGEGEGEGEGEGAGAGAGAGEAEGEGEGE